MSRVHPLVHRFLEDPSGLEQAEFDGLVTYLREHPLRAVELREQLLLDDYLSQKLAIDRQNFFAQIEQRIADFERGQEEMFDHVAELRAIAEGEIDKPLSEPPRGAWLKYSLAAAIALSLIAAVAAWQWPGTGPKAVALIEEVSGEVTIVRGQEQIAPRLGKAIYTTDQIVSTAGSTIEWKYKDETTVRLVGDTVGFVTADARTGAKQVTLDQGELVASVAKQVRGPMVFATPHATATVRGTQLRLVVGQADTQLDVTQGQVDLTRLADGRTIPVAANETGVASAERIEIKLPEWPVTRARAIYLFQGDPNNVLCRNPASGNFRESELTILGEEGALGSADDGADLATLVQRSGEFTVEIAFVPQAAEENSAGIIFSLGPQSEPGVGLRQEGRGILARVQASDGEVIELELGEVQAGQRAHVLLSGRNGRVAAQLNGNPTAERNDILVDTGSWKSGPLVLGADADGKSAWSGQAQRLAIFAHYMDGEEARREWERFELVHP
ncbi:MAG TPA: FecR domain-containing protein [Pirellulaceae bacterium]|nr:FecR domain-containing protein [Pirellulaceae bacterium]